MISIDKTGISNTPQSVTLSAPAEPMTINITGIPLTHNLKIAYVYLVCPITWDDVAEKQGTILSDSLTVTFNDVQPGSYYIDVGIQGVGWFEVLSPRSLVAGNNNILWSNFHYAGL
jgi:hypothetical protein